MKMITEIRLALRETYSKRNYRITKEGEIHVRGIMPNTNQKRCFLLGYMGYPEVEYQILGKSL